MSVWFTIAVGVGCIPCLMALFAIPLGVGTVAASIVHAWRSSTQSVYAGSGELYPIESE